MGDQYAAKWAEYRRISKFSIISLISIFVAPTVVFVMLIALVYLCKGRIPWGFAFVPFYCAAGFVISSIYFAWRKSAWKCPQCGRRFGRRSKCRGCGLPKWG
jgi:hypothetical protein